MITEDLKHVIYGAVLEAKRKGRDYIGQLQAAVKAVLAVRPDLSLLDIINMVNLSI